MWSDLKFEILSYKSWDYNCQNSRFDKNIYIFKYHLVKQVNLYRKSWRILNTFMPLFETFKMSKDECTSLSTFDVKYVNEISVHLMAFLYNSIAWRMHDEKYQNLICNQNDLIFSYKRRRIFSTYIYGDCFNNFAFAICTKTVWHKRQYYLGVMCFIAITQLTNKTKQKWNTHIKSHFSITYVA